ncbi:hypothetical protein F5Y16DRAFT_82448 [Xylariaceae sp. FL0255]|nr:hypothetical protein F5Y16DRAFT_82448 [Xylariaceae sp. FL0255]
MAPASFARRLFGGKAKRNEKGPRTLRQQVTSRPCPLANIPDDLILRIFDFVQAASPRTTATLTLVHPSLYQLARHVQHRTTTIDVSNKHGAAEKHLNLIEDELLIAIHQLRVVTHRRQVDEQCIQRLAGMINRMTALRSVHWEYAPIPASVLQFLPNLPFPVQLRVTAREDEMRRPDDQAARQILSVLAGCPVLTSLELDAAYTDAAGCRSLSRPLKQLLLTCPNLVHLSMDLYLPRTGCVRFGPSFEYPGIGFSAGEHPLRPLESLAVHDYPWGQEEVPGRLDLHSQGYPASGSEMDYWAANFDWSKLERLDISSPSAQPLAINLAPELAALKEVRFTSAYGDYIDSLGTFFDQVPSALEAIYVPNLDIISTEAFSRHAPSLRKLTVRQPETSFTSSWGDHILSMEALVELCEKAPYLEELSIDLIRVDGDWPRAKLELLARLASLGVLDLGIGFGDWADSGPSQPALTASAAAQLFTDLRQASPKLQQLRIQSGPSHSQPGGFAPDGPTYPEDNSASFSCCLSERDDEAAAGVVTVTSFRLSPRLNSRMQRILKGEEKREGVQGNLIALRVALDGPMQFDDWKLWKEQYPMPNFPALIDAAEGWTMENNNGLRGRLRKIWKH